MEHRSRRRSRPLGLEAPAKEQLAQQIASAVALSLERNRRENDTERLPGGVKRGVLASRLRLARQNVVDMTVYLQQRAATTAAIVEEQRQVSGCGDEHNVCVICLDGNLLESDVEALPCGHVFHAHCIAQWLQYRRVCPVDRRPVD
ncbi:E3 ubiquitin-protein ligase [Phytophthora citrophthora]|uniref:E3 ubiquitin-protein ligase n=1 Tax=Phytophthora citrophthora TaxID=4793 RepID=A0AAD9LMD3_9STRA|nr:E3 ubiquitin-protein ligase [Phytophthora citrophthora]